MTRIPRLFSDSVFSDDHFKVDRYDLFKEVCPLKDGPIMPFTQKGCIHVVEYF